jgi:hypothetical protein
MILILATTLLGCGDLEENENENGTETDDVEVVTSALSFTDRCNRIQTVLNSNGWLGAETTIGCQFHTVGAWRFFQNGNIFFHDTDPDGVARIVHGAIRAKYMALGAQAHALGWPISNEGNPRFGGGRFSAFQNGVILWKTGASQAREVHGTIHGTFGELGNEWGPLGWPISDEYILGTRNKNDFEFGKIYRKGTGTPWPFMSNQSNPNSRLAEAGFPRITSVTFRGTPGTFVSAQAEGFTPGRSVSLRLTSPDNAATWTHSATADANGRVSWSEKFAEQGQIIKAPFTGVATVWAFQDAFNQAVTHKLTAAGFTYAGTP